MLIINLFYSAGVGFVALMGLWCGIVGLLVLAGLMLWRYVALAFNCGCL